MVERALGPKLPPLLYENCSTVYLVVILHLLSTSWSGPLRENPGAAENRDGAIQSLLSGRFRKRIYTIENALADSCNLGVASLEPARLVPRSGELEL